MKSKCKEGWENCKLSPAKLMMEMEVKNQHYLKYEQGFACGEQALFVRKPKTSNDAQQLILAVLPFLPHRRAGDFFINYLSKNQDHFIFVIPQEDSIHLAF